MTTKLSICYMSPHVYQGFDLRGVVSPERAERLVSFIKQLLGPNREGASSSTSAAAPEGLRFLWPVGWKV